MQRTADTVLRVQLSCQFRSTEMGKYIGSHVFQFHPKPLKYSTREELQSQGRRVNFMDGGLRLQ